MKIAVAGTGYVGLSIATLLAQKNEVVAYNRHQEKCDKLNNRISLIQDNEIEEFFKTKKLNLFATPDYKLAFKDADYVVLAVPTNYDDVTNYFDCSAVEEVIEKVLEVNPKTTMIIKSTIPVGYTESIKKRYGIKNIIFSPEL